MSGWGTGDRKAGARGRARKTAQARARRKARLARVSVPSPPPRAKKTPLPTSAAPHAPVMAVLAAANATASHDMPSTTHKPVLSERAPRIALAVGTIVIGAVMLLLPATRPQWLSLYFAPQSRVADVRPETALMPREPLAAAQAVTVAAGARSAGEAAPRTAAAPAAPSPVAAGSPPARIAAVPSVSEVQDAADAAATGHDLEAELALSPPARVFDEALRSAPAAGVVSALAAYDAGEGDGERAARMARCEADFSVAGRSAAGPVAAVAPDAFGKVLAEAALQQTRGFGVYTDSYRTIAFPMGDVPALFGVCTDVVIRAYRALGIDLQARVHTARVGALDPSIAHRRTYTLRRYFASRGASLPISDFTEDYLPGDIVTYYRPQNSGSKDHIAIVADVIGPSGRPMIIHNRGWGTQIEDALFVDKITGHYRYTGAQPALAKIRAARQARQGPPAKASQIHSELTRMRRAKAARIVLKARSEGRTSSIKR